MTDCDLDLVLGLDEAAQLINRSPVTLRWAARTGRLAAKKIGRDWVTTRDDALIYAAMVPPYGSGQKRVTRKSIRSWSRWAVRP